MPKPADRESGLRLFSSQDSSSPVENSRFTHLSSLMPKTSSGIEPIFPSRLVGLVKYYRLQGLERTIDAPRHLFFESSLRTSAEISGGPIKLDRGEWVTTNTLRNSFFVEPVRQLTEVKTLQLFIDFSGALELSLYSSSSNGSTKRLSKVVFSSASYSTRLVAIGEVEDLPKYSRLFVSIRSLQDKSKLYDLSFTTTSPPKTTCCLAVCVRTYSRVERVKAMLRRFADAEVMQAFYRCVFDNLDFWVLDTSDQDCDDVFHSWPCDLNLTVIKSVNLGGGGNASHLLKLCEKSYDESGRYPTELLICDDDLTISAETVARYYTFCCYRSREVICSLPILMRSRPDIIWEDGAFWGREAGEIESFHGVRGFFPTLLRHGKRIEGGDTLDELSNLSWCEYSTFIFLGMSFAAFQQLGYPAPLFLRGDDVEYCLRASDHGIPIFTNPNLAAWHEPAHSYASEYLSIFHAALISLSYGSQGSEFFLQFFSERMLEHLSIRDGVGLSVYHQVVKDLVDKRTHALSSEFERHYRDRLSRFASIETQPFSSLEAPEAAENEGEMERLVLPFLYPGYRGQGSYFRQVYLVNAKGKWVRKVIPPTAREMADAVSEYLSLLAEFDESFDAIRAGWNARLPETTSDTFWESIRKKYAPCTRVLSSARRTPRGADCGNIDIGGASEQEGCVLATGAPKRWCTWSLGGFFFGAPKRLGFSVRKLAWGNLPDDFDPAVYLQLNQDLDRCEVDAGEHYLRFGQSEGRAYRWPRRNRESVWRTRCSRLLGRALRSAWSSLRLPGRLSLRRVAKYDALPADFVAAIYLEINPDVAEAGADPIEHYLRFGRREGRPYRWTKV